MLGFAAALLPTAPLPVGVALPFVGVALPFVGAAPLPVGVALPFVGAMAESVDGAGWLSAATSVAPTSVDARGALGAGAVGRRHTGRFLTAAGGGGGAAAADSPGTASSLVTGVTADACGSGIGLADVAGGAGAGVAAFATSIMVT